MSFAELLESRTARFQQARQREAEAIASISDRIAEELEKEGLVVVYDWFVKALTGTEYEGFAVEVRDRWRRRVAEKRWPHFTAS